MSLLTVRTEAALPLRVDEADRFIRSRPPGYWQLAANRGLNLYDGLRFVVSVRHGDAADREPDFLVEGTSSNLLLLVHEVAPGVRRCLEDGEGDAMLSARAVLCCGTLQVGGRSSASMGGRAGGCG